MKNKRKENFINDKRRRSYLASVYTRMYRGKSALIEGAYGAGKTRFLQLIQLGDREDSSIVEGSDFTGGQCA